MKTSIFKLNLMHTMHNNYHKLVCSLQKVIPFVCLLMPFVCVKSPVNTPLIGKKIPLVCYRGFTLIELIITLTIAGILAAVALPNMFSFFASNRLTSQANEIIADINISRSEAIKRGTNTGLCVTTNGTSCAASGNWANGWLVYFIDPVTSVSNTIRAHAKLPGSNTLTAPTVDVTFNRSGFLTSAAGDFRLCDSKLGKFRLVSITATGRPALSEGTCP